VHLVAVGQISKIFAIDDSGLVGDNDTSAWKGSFVHHLPEKIIEFGEVCGSYH
jgi:hypothetical protein